MTNKTKTIIGVVAVAGIGYYLYTQWKKKQGNKNFANYVDSDFFNAGGKVTGSQQTTLSNSGINIGASNCEVVQGNVGYVGMALSNNRIICSTGSGSTVICPRSQYGRNCGI